MFCPKCGAENADNSAFCEKCGQSLAAGAPVEPAAAPQAAAPQTAAANRPALIRETITSLWFRIGAIALAASAVLQLTGFFNNYILKPIFYRFMGDTLYELADKLPGFLARYIYMPKITVMTVLLALIALGVCAVKAAGIGQTHLDACKKNEPVLNTRGIKLFNIGLFANLGYLAIYLIYKIVDDIGFYIEAAQEGWIQEWEAGDYLEEVWYLFETYTSILVGAALCVLLLLMIRNELPLLENRPGGKASPAILFLLIFIALCALAFFALIDLSFVSLAVYAAFGVTTFLFYKKVSASA